MRVPGQGVEGETFEAVAEGWVPGDGEGALQRKHIFDDGAELGALGGIGSGEMLVAGEHAVGQAVIFVQLGNHFEDGGAVGGGAGDQRPDGAGLDGLAVVDAVGGEGEVLEAVALGEF